jgi:hypothetical protein
MFKIFIYFLEFLFRIIPLIILFGIFYFIFSFFFEILLFLLIIIGFSYFSFNRAFKVSKSKELETLLLPIIEKLKMSNDNSLLISIEKEFKEICNHFFPFNFLSRWILKIILNNALKETLLLNENLYSEHKIDEALDIFDITSVEYDTMSISDIKSKYKQLSKIFHPDKPTGSNEKMSKLNEAKDILLSCK